MHKAFEENSSTKNEFCRRVSMSNSALKGLINQTKDSDNPEEDSDLVEIGRKRMR